MDITNMLYTISEIVYYVISPIIMDFVLDLWNDFRSNLMISIGIGILIGMIFEWPKIEKMIIKIVGENRIYNINQRYHRFYNDCKIGLVREWSCIYKASLKIPKRLRGGVILALAGIVTISIGMMFDYYISILILILLFAIYIGHMLDANEHNEVSPLLEAAFVFSILSILPTCLEMFTHLAAILGGFVEEINTPSHLYQAIMILVIVISLGVSNLEKKQNRIKRGDDEPKRVIENGG